MPIATDSVLVIGLLLFGSKHAELAGKSVAISIETAAALAFGSLGACGMVGTQEVGLLGGHGTSLFSDIKMACCRQRTIGRHFGFLSSRYYMGLRLKAVSGALDG